MGVLKVVVHVGSLKTGSTFLQKLVWDNLELLARFGIHLPRSGVQSGHHFHIACATGFSYPSQRLPQAEAAVVVERLRAELDGCGHAVALLTSEHFDLGVSPEAVTRLTQALDGHEVEVVAYLRNQVDLIQSLYFERLKWGGRETYEEFARRVLREGFLDYDTRMAIWMNAGVKTHILDYGAARGDLAASLMRHVPGAPPSGQLRVTAKNVNESISPEAMEHVRRMNIAIEKVEARRMACVEMMQKVKRMRSRWRVSRRLPLPDVIRKALPELTAGNRRLARRIGAGPDFLGGDLLDYATLRTGAPIMDNPEFELELLSVTDDTSGGSAGSV